MPSNVFQGCKSEALASHLDVWQLPVVAKGAAAVGSKHSLMETVRKVRGPTLTNTTDKPMTNIEPTITLSSSSELTSAEFRAKKAASTHYRVKAARARKEQDQGKISLNYFRILAWLPNAEQDAPTPDPAEAAGAYSVKGLGKNRKGGTPVLPHLCDSNHSQDETFIKREPGLRRSSDMEKGLRRTHTDTTRSSGEAKEATVRRCHSGPSKLSGTGQTTTRGLQKNRCPADGRVIVEDEPPVDPTASVSNLAVARPVPEEEPEDQQKPNGRRWRHRLKLPSLLWLCKKRRQGDPDATRLRRSYLDAVDRDRFVAVVE